MQRIATQISYDVRYSIESRWPNGMHNACRAEQAHTVEILSYLVSFMYKHIARILIFSHLPSHTLSLHLYSEGFSCKLHNVQYPGHCSG